MDKNKNDLKTTSDVKKLEGKFTQVDKVEDYEKTRSNDGEKKKAIYITEHYVFLLEGAEVYYNAEDIKLGSLIMDISHLGDVKSLYDIPDLKDFSERVQQVLWKYGGVFANWWPPWWLIIVLVLNTKDVVDLWEAAATLIFFPFLVVI